MGVNGMRMTLVMMTSMLFGKICLFFILRVNEREEYCGRTHDEVDINMESNIANVETQEGLQFTSQDHDESSKDVDKSCDHFDEDLIKSSYFVEEKEVTNENFDEPEDKGDKMEGSIKEEKIEQLTFPVKSPTKQKEKGKQTEYEISSVNLLNENIPMEAEAEPEEEEFIFKQLILPQKTKDEEYSTPTSLHKSPASNLSTPKKHSPALKNVLKVENDNDKVQQKILLYLDLYLTFEIETCKSCVFDRLIY